MTIFYFQTVIEYWGCTPEHAIQAYGQIAGNIGKKSEISSKKLEEKIILRSSFDLSWSLEN